MKVYLVDHAELRQESGVKLTWLEGDIFHVLGCEDVVLIVVDLVYSSGDVPLVLLVEVPLLNCELEGLIYECFSVLVELEGQATGLSVGILAVVDRVVGGWGDGVVIVVISDLVDLVLSV